MTEILNQKSARWIVFLFVLLVWVGIYPLRLGQQELKGEEGRRILPAVTMFKTGNWVVPYIGGVPYHKKPPMINWLVAASFKLTGRHDEWSARLPSVLAVLGFVCLVVWLPGAWLPIGGRLIASLVFLTTVAMVEKGRLIEIEAVHVALTSMAVFCWLSVWMTGRSRWWLWLAPVPFLVAGMLTKGPVVLYFYYITSICVLAYAKRLKALVSIPHVLAVVLTLGLPAIWFYLASHQAGPDQAAGGASGVREMLVRMMPWRIEWGQWAENVLKSFFILLPWILLIPVAWKRELVEHVPPEQRPAFKGARLGLLLGFAIITLIPGNSSRYAMPVLGLMSVLLGWVLGLVPELPDRGRGWRSAVLVGFALAAIGALAGVIVMDHRFWPAIVAVLVICVTVIVFRERSRWQTPVLLSVLTALLVAIFMIQYILAFPTIARDSEERRPFASQINTLVPEGETLYVYKPGYQAFLFYVREPMDYLVRPDQIDSSVRYLLIREEAYEELAESDVFVSHSPTVLYNSTYRHKGDFLLLELAPGKEPAGSAGQTATGSGRFAVALSSL